MRKIALTNSDLVVLVDAADYEWLSRWNWQLSDSGYAFRCDSRRPARNVWMHREINQTATGLYTDHSKGNKLDNRRTKIRTATKSQNQANSRIYQRRGRQSKFKGVTWHKKAGKWAAQIMLNGKNYYLGLFTVEIDAAKAYACAAKCLFEDFACVGRE